MNNGSLKKLEQELFSSLDICDKENDCIFILGSPRTGSTILYQAVITAFKTGYIANITNDYFSTTPAIGFLLQGSKLDQLDGGIISKSSYGKTKGIMQPSEGSMVMKNWFGGGHPSQIKSADIIDSNAALHFKNTVHVANSIFNTPLVIKNAWNCFRIKSLTQLFPKAYFIWIRRDIASSAKSDLSARYVTKNDPMEWNSATPANISELMERPYWEQVVENQFEFNTFIKKNLSEYAPQNYCEVWYEDFCQQPIEALMQINKSCGLLKGENILTLPNYFNISESKKNHRLSNIDIEKIDGFIEKNTNRFKPFLFKE